jgi:DeoR/GlpR family transcriptional regulator of sugar metabolism
MFAVERQKHILETLRLEGAVWVSKLSQELGVTEETVRRDLEKLEKQEALVRTHGGAIPIDESNREMSLEKRKYLNTEAKERLAKEAASHVVPGDTIFLDASTTTFYMARELKNFRDITIVTNSMRVITELAGNPSIKVIGVGGFASSNQSFVGTLASNYIEENFFATKVFFSSRGVTVNGGILDSNEAECGIKKCMIKNSDQKFYLCDKSKIGRIGFAKLADFSEIDHFITEKPLSEEIAKALSDLNVKVTEV